MTNLYSMFQTNTDRNKNQNTKKIEILFDLKGNNHKIFDTEFYKNIVCVCGSCDLIMANKNEKDIITINNPNLTIHIEKGTNVELMNYSSETKVIIEYLREEI